MNRPPYVKKDQPHYYVHTDGRAYIDAEETCTACDGEGWVEVEIPGGRWNPSAQGGMWEPDYRRVTCDACNGTKAVSIERCARCGHDTVTCECDDDDFPVFYAEMDAVREVAARLTDLQAAADGVAGGLGLQLNIHRVPWNLFHALAASLERPVEYYRRTKEHSEFAAFAYRPNPEQPHVTFFAREA